MVEYIERENAYKLIIHDKERCPTADVVKVVRCKDCKNASSPDKHSCYCANFEEFVSLNDFCSYGELKERDGE